MARSRSKTKSRNVRQVTRSTNLLRSKLISVSVERTSKKTPRRFLDVPTQAIDKVQSYRSRITQPIRTVQDPFRTVISPRIKEKL